MEKKTKSVGVVLLITALIALVGGVQVLQGISGSRDYWTKKGEETTENLNTLEDGLNKLGDNEKTYLEGRSALKDGKQEYANGVEALEQGRIDFANGQDLLASKSAEYEAGVQKIKDAELRLAAGEKELAAGKAEYEKGKADAASAKQAYDAIQNLMTNGVTQPQALRMIAAVSGEKPETVKAGYENGNPTAQKEKYNLLAAAKTARETIDNMDKNGFSREQAAQVIDAQEGAGKGEAALQAHDAIKQIMAMQGINNPTQDQINAAAEQVAYPMALAIAKDRTAKEKFNLDAWDDATVKSIIKQQVTAAVQAEVIKALIEANQIPEGTTYDMLPAGVKQAVDAAVAGQNDKIDQITETNYNNALAAIEAGTKASKEYKSGVSAAAAAYSVVEHLTSADVTLEEAMQIAAASQGMKIEEIKAAYAAGADKAQNDAKGQLAKAKQVYDNAQQLMSGLTYDQAVAAASASTRTPIDLVKKGYENGNPQAQAAIAKQLAAGKAKLEAGEKELAAGKAEYAAGKAKLEAGAAALADGKKQLADAAAQLTAGEQKLADAKKQIEDGEKKLKEFEDGRAQVIDGLNQVVSAKPDREDLESIASRLGNGYSFMRNKTDLDIAKGLDAVAAARDYQGDSGNAITKELMSRLYATIGTLIASVLAVIAAVSGIRKKYSGAAVLAVIAAAAAIFGTVYSNNAGMTFQNLAGYPINFIGMWAGVILAVVAVIFAAISGKAKSSAEKAE